MKELFSLLARERYRWGLLVLPAILVFFVYSNDVRLSTDPIHYSAIARTMADSGDFGSLKLGDEPYYLKPPLLFWLSALAIKCFGPIPFAVTLFSRLFGLAAIFVTGWLGRRLYGEKIGWVSAFVLLTTFMFAELSTTFRLDSALIFGITLAIYAYMNGDKAWGPPLFYGAIAIGTLAKGPPGIMPLFLAPLHAMLSGNFLNNKKAVLRWLIWSPLLLVPLAWWGYLYWQEGSLPFTVFMRDMVRAKGTGLPRWNAIWKIYVLQFSSNYWPWLPLLLIGAWMVCRDGWRAKPASAERAAAGVLMGWIGITFASCAVKNAQYVRYVLMAVPAFSIVAAVAVVRLCGDWFCTWMPRVSAAVALIAATLLACYPVVDREGEKEQYTAIAQILDQRLPSKTPVPLVASKARLGDDPNRYRADRARCMFFFNRSIRLVNVEEILQTAAEKRFTFLIRSAEYDRVAATLPAAKLISAKSFVLAEIDLTKK